MIFYFSATGNTRWAAQQLSEKTGERLIFIPDAMEGQCHYTLTAGERIGFCFPVHAWRPPVLVRRFIEKLSIANTEGHYCFALCTAGDTTGESMRIFRRALAQRSLHLDAVFSLLMPESYVGLPFMDVDTIEKEREKKNQAKIHLTSIVAQINEAEKVEKEPNVGRWPRINSRVIGDFFERKLVNDKAFRVETNRCVRCGVCAEVCPTADIEGGKGQEPTWKHNGSCLTCFACYHHCPQHAIEFGRQTKKKGQYWYGRNQL